MSSQPQGALQSLDDHTIVVMGGTNNDVPQNTMCGLVFANI